MQKAGSCQAGAGGGSGTVVIMGSLHQSLSLLVIVLLNSLACFSLSVNISEVSSYTKLRNWKESTLYRVETDAAYEINPLLLHLVGSRYGEHVAMQFDLSL